MLRLFALSGKSPHKVKTLFNEMPCSRQQALHVEAGILAPDTCTAFARVSAPCERPVTLLLILDILAFTGGRLLWWLHTAIYISRKRGRSEADKIELNRVNYTVVNKYFAKCLFSFLIKLKYNKNTFTIVLYSNVVLNASFCHWKSKCRSLKFFVFISKHDILPY